MYFTAASCFDWVYCTLPQNNQTNFARTTGINVGERLIHQLTLSDAGKCSYGVIYAFIGMLIPRNNNCIVT